MSRNELRKTLQILAASLWMLTQVSCRTSNGADMGNHRETSDSVSFLVVGDWGKMGKGAQQRVARGMDLASQKHSVQFIVTAGDNFYYRGVWNTTDPHWKRSFEDVYTLPGHNVPWYPVLGNHDYGHNPQAQIEYSKLSGRWRMPARYYKLEKGLRGTGGVLLAFTDTSPFVTASYGANMADLPQQDTAAQRAWLGQTLSNSKAHWKIVIGHHPLYSAGKHGNTPELINRFKPLLLHSSTDFYLAGHDHSLQHLAVPGEKTTYLVSGGGSEHTYITPHPYRRYARSLAGFLVMTLYAEKAVYYFYNAAGRLLYRQEVQKS
jgi:hypothetical protein